MIGSWTYDEKELEIVPKYPTADIIKWVNTLCVSKSTIRTETRTKLDCIEFDIESKVEIESFSKS